MIESPTFALLSAGLGLGLLHAFDADHIMAVSTLSNKRPSIKQSIKFCVQWAMGHGGVLIALGLFMFALGIQIPESLSFWAERIVGFMLIGLGLWLLFSLWKQSIHMHVHQHGDVTHVHLSKDHSNKHNHTPILVGITHGLAGSAPVLALIPAVSQGQLDIALGYIVLFSVGVMVSMFLFGASLGSLQKWLQNRSNRLFNISRGAVACFSIVLGSLWITESFAPLA